MRLFIIAGEASGDQLGAHYLKNLKKSCGNNLVICGVGGPQMTSQGLKSLFPMEELSVMGIAEVLPRILSLLKRIRQTSREIERFQPDLVVTIDSPDFCFRVVKNVRRSRKIQAKFIHYVAPSVWAWRPGRAKKLAKLYDGVMCLFPFEGSYFEAVGMRAAYVGHPVTEIDFQALDKKQARDVLGVADDHEVLCVLFGSRNGEVVRHGKIFAKVAQDWLSQNDARTVLVQTLPHLEQQIRALCAPFKDRAVISAAAKNKETVFIASDKALAVSGTIGLELAVARLPHIVAYKMNWLTFQIAKRVVKTRFAHLANIICGKQVVPEFIQEMCSPQSLLKAVNDMEVKTQKKGFEKLRQALEIRGDEGNIPKAVAFTRTVLTDSTKYTKDAEL